MATEREPQKHRKLWKQCQTDKMAMPLSAVLTTPIDDANPDRVIVARVTTWSAWMARNP